VDPNKICVLNSVVDPNRLCSDPDPDSHVHSYPDPDPAPGSEQDPNKFGSRFDLNLSNFLKIKALTVVKMRFLVPTEVFHSSNFKVNLCILKD